MKRKCDQSYVYYKYGALWFTLDNEYQDLIDINCCKVFLLIKKNLDNFGGGKLITFCTLGNH